MTAPRHAYAIEPIRQQRGTDPVTTMMEDAWRAAHGEPLASLPVQLTGWRLVLLRDGIEVERREFDGGDEAYTEAQEAGSAWLQQQGGSSVDAFTARAMQASKRMAWDHGYRHRISQRGF
ncbi:MAG: hypothetical protein M9927_24990 [Anaerolineae bacterium]|nr:hypothetical protein [Anaerolineae bacterium]